MNAHETCRHCGYWIVREGDGPWVHATSGLIPCFADTDAAPVLS